MYTIKKGNLYILKGKIKMNVADKFKKFNQIQDKTQDLFLFIDKTDLPDRIEV
jgi:hypothetical protein